MQRYEKARSYVYSRYSKIYNDTIHERAFTHTSSVDNFMTLLAISHSLPIEIAKIAALFHDYATFAHNCPSKDHARLSSLHAYHYLSETQEFSTNEIDEICYAIAQHSKKSEFSDDPLAEALKDADVFAEFVEEPHTKFDPVRSKRLLKAGRDLAG